MASDSRPPAGADLIITKIAGCGTAAAAATCAVDSPRERGDRYDALITVSMAKALLLDVSAG
jgi:hypothetical protein